MTAKINLELSKAILTDSNCWHRRFFRCWIDGSYNGDGHYRRNCELVRKNYTSDRRLRALAITEFCDFMAAEFDCSPNTVRQRMVEEFTREQLERLNAELIDDLRDLVRESMEDTDAA